MKNSNKNNKQEQLLREFIQQKISSFISENKKKQFTLRQFIRQEILREADENKQFSKYFGINVLNHDVLAQIKDDIHTKTKALGDDDEFVEFFKRYVLMYLEDLIEVSFDIKDIDNEIDQIKNVILEKNIRLDFNPDEPTESPIDPSLLNNDSNNVETDVENKEETEQERMNQIMGSSTKELESPEDREIKRKSLELSDGGMEDAKRQALDLMNDIDDIILQGYEKISDELNRELFIRYLVINVLLHIDKAHAEMKEVPEEVEIPEYEKEKEELLSPPTEEPVPEMAPEELPL